MCLLIGGFQHCLILLQEKNIFSYHGFSLARHAALNVTFLKKFRDLNKNSNNISQNLDFQKD